MKKLVIAMTFKDLRKFVPTNSSQQGRQQQITLFSSRVCDKPFWTWNIEDQVADLITNGDFCFNHIIAYQKNAQNKPSLIMKRFYLILLNSISISG